MKELRDSLGQAVNLIIQDGNDAIYVEKMEGVQPVRVYTAVGRKHRFMLAHVQEFYYRISLRKRNGDT